MSEMSLSEQIVDLFNKGAYDDALDLCSRIVVGTPLINSITSGYSNADCCVAMIVRILIYCNRNDPERLMAVNATIAELWRMLHGHTAQSGESVAAAALIIAMRIELSLTTTNPYVRLARRQAIDALQSIFVTDGRIPTADSTPSGTIFELASRSDPSVRKLRSC